MELKKELVRLEETMLSDYSKEDIRRLYQKLGDIDDALDCLKMNFMLASQDEFGNDIDFICYKQEERTLLERKELMINYIKGLFTDFLIKEIYENYKEDEMYRRLRNIYTSLFGNAIFKIMEERDKPQLTREEYAQKMKEIKEKLNKKEK